MELSPLRKTLATSSANLGDSRSAIRLAINGAASNEHGGAGGNEIGSIRRAAATVNLDDRIHAALGSESRDLGHLAQEPGMNFCPPKPGLTDMTRTRSRSLMMASRELTE